MPLVNSQVKEAKPQASDYKMSAGGGMCLLVKKNASKYWRFDYRFHGKRKTLAIGVYPIISLKDACEKLWTAKIHLSNDQDPSEVRKEAKRAKLMSNFADVSRQWWEHNKELGRLNMPTELSNALKIMHLNILGICPLTKSHPSK